MLLPFMRRAAGTGDNHIGEKEKLRAGATQQRVNPTGASSLLPQAWQQTAGPGS